MCPPHIRVTARWEAGTRDSLFHFWPWPGLVGVACSAKIKVHNASELRVRFIANRVRWKSLYCTIDLTVFFQVSQHCFFPEVSILFLSYAICYRWPFRWYVMVIGRNFDNIIFINWKSILTEIFYWFKGLYSRHRLSETSVRLRHILSSQPYERKVPCVLNEFSHMATLVLTVCWV
jgi:hypothetical protein